MFQSQTSPGFRTIEALRARVIRGLHDALDGVEIVPAQEDPNRLLVHRPGIGDAPGVVHLGNLATELVGQLSRHEAEARIADFIRMVQKLAHGAPRIEAARLYPALRHRDFPANSGAAPLVRPGPGDCVAVLMSDEGSHTAMVTGAMLEDAGLEAEAAWDAAEENFAHALTGLALFEMKNGMRSFEIDDFEWMGSSLLLAPAVMGHVLRGSGLGPVYLAAPTREAVDFIAVDTPDALAIMERWMAARLTEAHPQSDMVFRFAPGDAQPRPAYFFSDDRLHGLS